MRKREAAKRYSVRRPEKDAAVLINALRRCAKVGSDESLVIPPLSMAASGSKLSSRQLRFMREGLNPPPGNQRIETEDHLGDPDTPISACSLRQVTPDITSCSTTAGFQCIFIDPGLIGLVLLHGARLPSHAYSLPPTLFSFHRIQMRLFDFALPWRINLLFLLSIYQSQKTSTFIGYFNCE